MYTLPTYDNLWNKKGKGFSAKNNTVCTCTDLALVLGAYTLVDSRICEYYTQTKSLIEIDQIISCNVFGDPILTRTNNSKIVIRPVIENDQIIDSNTPTFEYGEYPQSAASEIESLKLEKALIYGEIKKTNKRYTMYYAEIYTKHFLDKINVQEYIFKNQKYVRLIAKPTHGKAILSNGITINSEEPVWIKVEPITWIKEENSKIAISEKGLITGIPYNKNPYEPYFYNSFIENYLNNTFSKEIIPNKEVVKVKKFN